MSLAVPISAFLFSLHPFRANTRVQRTSTGPQLLQGLLVTKGVLSFISSSLSTSFI